MRSGGTPDAVNAAIVSRVISGLPHTSTSASRHGPNRTAVSAAVPTAPGHCQPDSTVGTYRNQPSDHEPGGPADANSRNARSSYR
jgi:hypothetical protein